MTTRGIECLKQAGVRFEILPYCHEAKGAKPVAEALGLPEEIVIKTIVFLTDDRSFLLALMGGRWSGQREETRKGEWSQEGLACRTARRGAGYWVSNRRNRPVRAQATVAGALG